MKGRKHKVGFLISSIWPNFIGWHYHRGQLRHLPAGGWEGRALFETNSWGDEPRKWRDLYISGNLKTQTIHHINQSLNLRYCPPFCFYHTGLYNLLGCRHICGKPTKGVLQQTSAAFPKNQGLPEGVSETKGLKSMQQRQCSEKTSFPITHQHQTQCKCLQLPKWWFWFIAQAFCKQLKGSNSKPR